MTPLLTIQEAADALRVGTTTVKKLVARGALESVKIGKSRRIVAASVDDFVTTLRGAA